MTNTSATGGYLLPSNTVEEDDVLTDAIQGVVAGITGLDPTLVRPRWQPEPPDQPDAITNWVGLGVTDEDPDVWAYVTVMPDGSYQLQRTEQLEVMCSFYGPSAGGYAGVLRDGLQIQQNLDQLNANNLKLIKTGHPKRIPELVNKLWLNRVDVSVFLKYLIVRTYPILTVLSADGRLYAEASDGVIIRNICVQQRSPPAS